MLFLLLPAAYAVPSLADMNAQEIIRQQERERAQQSQLQTRPDVQMERPAVEAQTIPADESPCFPIREVTLEGELADKFQWAAHAADMPSDRITGRCLGAQGINLVMRRIQNLIIAKGYVTTRVLAREQDLTSGVLVLTLIPGKVRHIRLASDSETRINLATTLPLHSGDLLNLRDIEQGLENLKRTPTADADIRIEPTENAGESDLVIRWKQAFPLRLSISADDSGSRATGRYQGNVTLSVDNPLALSDTFYISAGHDILSPGHKGTKNYLVYYGVPIGNWFLSFSASSNEYYQTVVGSNVRYEYSGESRNMDARLSRLLYRDATKKLYLNTRLWRQSTKNFVEDTEVEIQRRVTAGWEAGLSYKQFIGQASLDASINYRRGTGAMHALRAPEEDFDEGTSRAGIIFVDMQYNQPFNLLNQHFRYTATYRGQWNRDPLTPLDKFTIGNRYTVRGFDGENTLSAERGWFIRNDLALAIPAIAAETYIGLDYGRLGGPSTRWLAGDHLAGGVIGLRGNISRYFSYDVFAGWPIKKPKVLHTAGTTFGFSAYLSF